MSPTANATTAAHRRRRPAWRRRRALAGWLLALPFTALFAAFMVGPLTASLALSFSDATSRDLRTPFAVGFVGLSNFVDLFSDEKFLRAIGNTLYFAGVGVPLTVAVAMLIALALNNGITRFRTLFRVGFYTPVVTSIVAIAVVWKYILEPDGLLNQGLAALGVTGPDWLHDTGFAMPSMILMAMWRNMGTLMIVFLAGLQGLPAEVYEAARMDGANSFQRFRSLTLPLMRPTILLGCVLISVYYFQFFEEAFVMTGGGPLDSTLSITYFTYNQFGYGNYGYASAASYVLAIAIAVVTLVQFRVLRPKD
ncbi:sugar ABC transporter permease [Acrocarpospora pleiomorpha]|uniref:Sugar ABC transporter permease n=1 Tax=Acrocarpospora pleiomorpha TaxID=90975 RepID=A0A5M3XBZ6_9ACTN|nr:sugar ABC transporter permease [Acrocarpospora pleiomorpha]GES19195.1 sugar ABC transporter permease [Acrocarpospora pleiomorpha]